MKFEGRTVWNWELGLATLLFESNCLNFSDQSDNKIVMLLKTPELVVDILSVENQCGTPVRYPDFNNYTEVLIQKMRMDWRTSGLSDNWNLEIETNCEASGRVRRAERNISSG